MALATPKQQQHVVAACYLGWTLDAFDFFILVFVLRDVAHEFNVDITTVTVALTLTLALRPVGAWLFGRAAEIEALSDKGVEELLLKQLDRM